uniref:Uncharacterized protein n=1 Tax=Lactuca sativa TaxID=4236 RepID=A0A9R1VEH1_LACSA|nr:hypothetical protein LSAT_V11C500256230 [Lactuca sativa]
MKGSEINAYIVRFNDLAVICPTLVTPEYKKTERYIWGLASQIKGMVIASKPTTYDSAKCIAHQLTSTEIQRQDVATNYVAITTILIQTRKYVVTFPWFTQCNRHHLRNCSWCSQCNHQHRRDTLPIIAGAQHIQQKIKEQPLKQAIMEDEHVLSVVKFHISRKNVQSEGLGYGRAFVIGSKEAIQDPVVESGTKKFWDKIYFNGGRM